MPTNNPTWPEIIWAWILATPLIVAALWGALGGATNALVIRVTALEALRHIGLGALFAAGVGGLGGPLLEHWGVLPAGAVTSFGAAAGSSVAYLTGSIGAAVFEVLLSRVRAALLPTDKGSGA